LKKQYLTPEIYLPIKKGILDFKPKNPLFDFSVHHHVMVNLVFVPCNRGTFVEKYSDKNIF